MKDRDARETDVDRLARLYAAQSRINQAIVRLPTRDELFVRVCQILVEQGGFAMAWIGWHDEATLIIEPVARWGDDHGYVDAITVYSDGRPDGGGGPTETAFVTGRVAISNDVRSDPELRAWQGAIALDTHRSTVALPIRENGEVRGTLNVYSDEIGFFQDGEVALLLEAVVDISFGLDNVAREQARLDAERALRESEHRFRATFEQNAVGIAHVAIDGTFLRVNNRLCQITGYPRDELLNKPYFEMAIAEEGSGADQIRSDLRASVASATPIERRFRRKDDTTYMASIAADLVVGPDGEPRYVVVVVQDVTERKAAEMKLQRSESRYHSLFENMLEGYAYCEAIFDGDTLKDFCYVTVNAAFTTLTGLHDVVGKRVSEVIPGFTEASPDVMAMFERVTRTGVPERTEVFVEALQLWLAVVVYSPDTTHFVAVFDNINERKRTELKLTEQADLLDQARDAIFVRDLQHRISYWSKGAERIFGWTSAEATGRVANELLGADPDAFGTANTTVFETGAWTGEITKVTKAGATLAVESRWTLVRDAGGEPKSILVIDTDITERKLLEVQFLRAQRMESIGTLAGGIAHDLNNVFAPIVMSLELLRADTSDPAALELVDMVSASAQRGADMVKQLLQFARGVEGRRLAVEVQQLFRDVERIIRDTLPRNIELRTIIPGPLSPVLGDPTQLHRVLMNLCVNASDAMPNGGALVLSAEHVSIDAQYAALDAEMQVGEYVLFQVEDNGTGMPTKLIEKIFDPFFTTKEVGKGTGLGLSTSLAIVKSHGGVMRVYSELGKGSTFKLFLPAHVGPVPETTALAPAELTRGNGELVLVIDDEAAVREITRQTMEAFGYRVLLAADGAEAVAIFAGRKDDIAAVVTDVMMPVLDGPATIEVLRQLQPDVRIIAASGLHADGHVWRSARLGVKHFLTKPYTAQTLLRVVREVLDATPPPR